MSKQINKRCPVKFTAKAVPSARIVVAQKLMHGHVTWIRVHYRIHQWTRFIIFFTMRMGYLNHGSFIDHCPFVSDHSKSFILSVWSFRAHAFTSSCHAHNDMSNIISLIPRLSHRLSYVTFRTISLSWNSSPNYFMIMKIVPQLFHGFPCVTCPFT